jgi:serine/threonine-protein kinase PRP4
MSTAAGKPKVRKVTPTAPTKSLRATMLGSHSAGDDRELVSQLADLLEKCLALDPKRRCTVLEALAHPFIKTVR